jgi:predicted permease
MRLYGALLHLYPASFRRQYGGEMRAIFARRRRDAEGLLGAAALWLETAWDLLSSAGAAHWDLLRQDLRYTARTLGRAPGFVATVLLVVALGVGANVAVFSLTDFVLVRPLPFRQPERLVKLWENLPGYTRMEASPANYRDWKRMSRVFSSMGAMHGLSVNLVGQGEPVRLEGQAVTADLFPTLGVRPVLGRLFTAAEDRPGTGGTLLLSHALWQQQFAGDPAVLGRRVSLDGKPFLIIGVMPPDFHFPDRRSVLWTPAQFGAEAFEDRNDNWLEVAARLAPGVTLAQARAEMKVVAARLARQYPKEDGHIGINVIDLREEVSERSRLLLVALCGAALCVLLIACANLASLLLARALGRRRELEVRSALGAGRERLVRQLVTESLVLAVAGGVLGVMAALVTLPLLARLVPASLPIAETPSIDLRVLAFAGLLTGATGLAFGLVPALRAGRRTGFVALREGSRALGGRRGGLRAALVTVEVAASVVLLISAGLLIRALWRLQSTDLGFRPAGVLTLRTALPRPKYDPTARRAELYSRVLSGVRALPGVSGAAYVSWVPLVMGGGIWPVLLDGQQREDREESHTASLRFVTPGYFATMGIPFREGRDVADADRADRPFVAVVSESFARRFWPGRDALGRTFKFAFHDRVVAGVVGDVRVRGVEQTSEPQVYLPYLQVEDGSLPGYAPKDLVLRTSVSTASLLPAVRRIVREVAPEQPISDVRTLAEVVAGDTASRAVQVRVLAVFAAVAFLLAAVGIHGLLAFAVSQRTREIGVRRALGAPAGEIVKMVTRQGVATAALGVGAGVALAYAAGRSMQALLAGVDPADAPTFAAAAVLGLVMTVSGTLVPSLRALRVDPLSVVREE